MEITFIHGKDSRESQMRAHLRRVPVSDSPAFLFGVGVKGVFVQRAKRA
jgi:hypothetical protein